MASSQPTFNFSHYQANPRDLPYRLQGHHVQGAGAPPAGPPGDRQVKTGLFLYNPNNSPRYVEHSSLA